MQAAIMFLGLIATLAKGVVDVGGWEHVMNISRIGGRLDMGTYVGLINHHIESNYHTI